MNINVSHMKFRTKVSKKQSMKTTSSQDNQNRKLTLKEMQEREYPSLDSDVPEIFDVLLELKLIEFSEIKRPNEAGRIEDPNYCKYHRLVGHSLKKYFVFRDRVMQLANEKKIFLEDDKTSFNQISITFGSLVPVQICNFEEYEEEEPLEQGKTQVDEADNEGWILVTRRRRCKANPQKESSKELIRKRMVRRPRKLKSAEHPKNAKVEMHHHQKPRRPVTLVEFFPRWFCAKDARGNIEASCFNADKEETKNESIVTLPSSSSESRSCVV